MFHPILLWKNLAIEMPNTYRNSNHYTFSNGQNQWEATGSFKFKMGRHHRLMTWSFLLILALLLYQSIIIDASPNIEENHLDLHDRLSKVEAHDRLQDGEISLLKVALDAERNVVHDLTSRIEVLEDSNTILGRPKRPVRLLPPYLFQ